MEIPAKVSAKGQITIPKQVRDDLGITGGEEILFRIEYQRAVLARDSALLGPDPAQEDTAAPAPPRRVPWDAARHVAARRRPGRGGAVVVRDTDGSPLTIELVDKAAQPSRR